MVNVKNTHCQIHILHNNPSSISSKQFSSFLEKFHRRCQDVPAHRKEVFHNNIKTCISNCFHPELHWGQHSSTWSSRYSWEQAIFWWHHKNTIAQATTCYYGNHSFYRCWMPERLKTPFGCLLVKSLPIFDASSNRVHCRCTALCSSLPITGNVRMISYTFQPRSSWRNCTFRCILKCHSK